MMTKEQLETVKWVIRWVGVKFIVDKAKKALEQHEEEVLSKKS